VLKLIFNGNTVRIDGDSSPILTDSGGKLMIKLIATDMDGTLLNSNGELNEEIYSIVGRLKGMGIKFAAASGRQLMSLKRKFEPVDEDIIYIAENGAYALDRDEELYINAIDKDTVAEIIETSKEVNGSAIFICGKKYSYTDNEELFETMKKPIFGYEIKYVSDLRTVNEDILKIVNLKHAWEFILNKNVILSNTNFALLCEINKMIEDGFYYTAGKVRSTPVSIGGTTWKPDLPIENVIKEELEEIFSKDMNDLERAIELLLYIMKKQIFIDGNKRTAVIYSNHYLISRGEGIIAIPAELTDEFKDLLIPYYEGKDEKKIKEFIKEKCYISI